MLGSRLGRDAWVKDKKVGKWLWQRRRHCRRWPLTLEHMLRFPLQSFAFLEYPCKLGKFTKQDTSPQERWCNARVTKTGWNMEGRHKSPVRANLAERNRTLRYAPHPSDTFAQARSCARCRSMWKYENYENYKNYTRGQRSVPLYQIYDLDSPLNCHFPMLSLMHWNDAPTVRTFLFLHSTTRRIGQNFSGF